MASCNHKLNFPAIRAWYRAWGPIDNLYTEAMYYDTAMDYGEFSGPEICKRWDAERQRVAEQVAGRFGLTVDELLSQAECCYPMHEQDILISKGLY